MGVTSSEDVESDVEAYRRLSLLGGPEALRQARLSIRDGRFGLTKQRRHQRNVHT